MERDIRPEDQDEAERLILALLADYPELLEQLSWPDMLDRARAMAA